jgi:DNA-binding transcriptional ArsR family regulator
VVVSELRNAYGGRLPQGTPRRPSDLGRFLDNVSRELALFWRWAVAPLWTRLRGCLDAEVVYRSRVLAFGGAAALFENLHHAIEFTPRRSGGILRVRSRQQINRRGGGAGLVLVPSVFCWPDAYVVAREPWRPTVAYPARGVADVWDPAAADSPFLTRALEALIGTARARVLQGLARNPTTTGLAAALRMSPSTVSTHLARLHDAGVLTRTRVGHKVLYAANQRGLELLRQYDGSSGLAPGGKLGLLRQR